MKTAESTAVRTLADRVIACLASLALAAALVPALSFSALSEEAWADDLSIELENAESGSGTSDDPYIFTYTGSAIDLGVSISGSYSVSGYSSSASTSSITSSNLTSLIDVGDYTFLATSDLTTYVYVYFTIQMASLSGCSVSAEDLTWTGSSQTPELTFTDSSGSALTLSSGYTVSYYATTSAGNSTDVNVSDGTTTYYATGDALTGLTDVGTYIVAVTGDGTSVDSSTTIYCLVKVEAVSLASGYEIAISGGSGDSASTFCPGNISGLQVTVCPSGNSKGIDSSCYDLSYTDSSGNTVDSLASVTTEGTWTVTATGTGSYYTDSVSTTVTLAHSLTYTAGQSATCDENGTLEYVTCSICGNIYALADGATSESPAAGDELESTTAAATGHTYPDASDTTCVSWDWSSLPSAATVTITCTVCNKTFATSQITDITSTVTTAATYTAAGVMTYTATYTAANGTTYTGTTTAAIDQLDALANTMTVKAKKITVKGKTKDKKLKSNVVYKRAKVVTVKKAMGAVTCKKSGSTGGKLITVAKNGKLTLKKGLKAGTYTVKVKVTAAGGVVNDVAYNSKSKTVKVKVTVK